MTMTEIALNAGAVVGAGLLLFGFYRVNIGRWNNKSLWYELDNVIGALLIIVYQVYYHAYVTVVVNAIWAVVAMWGIFMFMRRLRHHTKKRKRANA